MCVECYRHMFLYIEQEKHVPWTRLQEKQSAKLCVLMTPAPAMEQKWQMPSWTHGIYLYNQQPHQKWWTKQRCSNTFSVILQICLVVCLQWIHIWELVLSVLRSIYPVTYWSVISLALACAFIVNNPTVETAFVYCSWNIWTAHAQKNVLTAQEH